MAFDGTCLETTGFGTSIVAAWTHAVAPSVMTETREREARIDVCVVCMVRPFKGVVRGSAGVVSGALGLRCPALGLEQAPCRTPISRFHAVFVRDWFHEGAMAKYAWLHADTLRAMTARSTNRIETSPLSRS